jgi:electron transfer flavoprotein alpha subunit
MILVVVEHEAGAPDRLSMEALTLGRSLAEATGTQLHAVAWGDGGAAPAGALGSAGVAALHTIGDPRLTDYAPEAIGKAIAQLVERERPELVIGTGSERGAEVLAHVAARTGLALAANVTAVRPGDPWEVTRQRWGGSLLEEARLDGPVRLVTVAPHAFEPAGASAAGGAGATTTSIAVEAFAPDLADRDFRVRITSHVPAEAGKISLADARVVVGGGRGVGSAEGFAELDELAALLGGTVGVSRVVTSAGWRPHAQQVGQTGTRIAPDLYIACGISGAIQHMVGARSAKAILAINTDRDAPMVTRATYAVIGDLHTVLPAIIAEVKAAR